MKWKSSYIGSESDTIRFTAIDIAALLNACERLDALNEIALLRATEHEVWESRLYGSIESMITVDTVRAFRSLLVIWTRPGFGLTTIREPMRMRKK